jgi:hypothetical protein
VETASTRATSNTLLLQGGNAVEFTQLTNVRVIATGTVDINTTDSSLGLFAPFGPPSGSANVRGGPVPGRWERKRDTQAPGSAKLK